MPMSDKQRFSIRKLREEQKLIHELSKLAIIVGGIILLGVSIWRFMS